VLRCGSVIAIRVEGGVVNTYQMQKALYDHLRERHHAPPGEKPAPRVEGYDLTDEERTAVESLDIGKLYEMGTHPVIINGLCRAMGYRRADYRPLLAGSASANAGRARWRR
jgi:hypothetical protein